MPEQQQQDQISFLLSDFNARLRDTEEKNRVLKERILILGNNLLALKESADSSLDLIKRDLNNLKKDTEIIKSVLENLIRESNSFVRKDEIVLIERMLKDFYPIDFARVKDIEGLVQDKINKLKEGLPLHSIKREKKHIQTTNHEEHKKLNENINHVMNHLSHENLNIKSKKPKTLKNK